MRKKLIATTILSAFLCTFFPAPAALAADNVQVTLPSFTVTLNGQSTSNDYSKYPLLVYKDITYFPMTYYDCRLLGIKTDWTKDTGLVIDKNEDYFYEYMREVNNSKNARKQTAKIADGKITINGKVVDNRKEEYPLLVFRDVTYFPLTWRFAVDELGWQYRFNHQEGLVIDNDKVKLENPNEWTYVNKGYGGEMGKYSPITVDSFLLTNTQPLSKKEYLENYLLRTGINFYNVTNKNIYLKDFAPLKYCIYKPMQGREELLYWQLAPAYNGVLKDSCYCTYDMYVKFWKTAPLGKYTIEMQAPTYTNYQDMVTEKWYKEETQFYYGKSKTTFDLTK